MARNFTKHYETYGDEDFTIYDGEFEEEDTRHEDAYYANGGEGCLDEDHNDAITKDAVESIIKENARELKKIQALKHSVDLQKEMTDEEYQHFLWEQKQEQYYTRFQIFLTEFRMYVPDMLEARNNFHAHQGILMSGNLINLDQQKLFYF
jgi:hypothetical protein